VTPLATARLRRNKLLTPARIAVIYVTFGSLWILFSDTALHALVADAELEAQLQTVKGWFFVLVTGALVFLLARAMHRTYAAENRERMRAEADLTEALENAERANRAKSQFLATMSHEFRTPLNAILGFSEILRAEIFGPLGIKSYKEYAGDIYRSGSLMLALVNDILDISEIEAGKRQITKETVELPDLLEACLKDFKHAAEHARVTLALDRETLAPTIYGDRVSIIQVVSNLLGNAIKYNRPGGHIDLAAPALPDGSVRIAVTDTGIGIPPDKLPTIAEPFAQVIADPHLTSNGKGLGLAIVNSLAAAHGGQLAIDSILGEGTTVSVSFPPPGDPAKN
tara:strand:- start:107 stop:1126 length:1020 start_codon:yes stop_codon:yes gene_type:complete